MEYTRITIQLKQLKFTTDHRLLKILKYIITYVYVRPFIRNICDFNTFTVDNLLNESIFFLVLFFFHEQIVFFFYHNLVKNDLPYVYLVINVINSLFLSVWAEIDS